MAQLAHFYPSLPLVSPHWGTADGWMPWPLVMLLYRQLRHVLALDRLNIGNAVALGAAMVIGDRKKVQAAHRALFEEAYPRG